MGKTKYHLLALALIGATPLLANAEEHQEDQNLSDDYQPKFSIFKESEQAQSNGFLKDSDLKLLFRNYYMNRDFRNSSNQRKSPNGKRQSYREEWGQSFISTYYSGFTEGTVGFGVDAFGMYGVRLDSGRGRSGTGLLPRDSDGRANSDFSRAGGALKMRLSNTTLKYGQQMVDTPVFSTDDGRLFPETAEGFLLTSEEIKNLTLQAGHFTALNAMAQTYRDSIDNGWDLYRYGSHKQGHGLKRADFIGGTYQFTNQLSTSLYYSDVKDFWKKQYANINYNLPITDQQSLNFDFNYYHTKSQGEVKRLSPEVYNGHKIDSQVWGLRASYSIGAHKFTLAHTRVTGHGPGNPYTVEGGGAIYLPNSVQYSDFNNENERSWQARYDLDMTPFGVPGLSFMTRYIRGTNISSYLRDDRKSGGKVSEWEHDMEAKYVVQEGKAKNLSFRLRVANYRSSGFADDVTDIRFITEYPWDILGTFRK